RQVAAQWNEARMHLSRDRARERARRWFGRPKAGIWIFLGEIFKDRKRFPDLHLAVGKRWHLPGAGDSGHPRFEIVGIKRDHLFVESDARDLHGNPWAQRPRGIVLVPDDEFERHPSCRDVLRLLARSLEQRVDVKVICRGIAYLRR